MRRNWLIIIVALSCLTFVSLGSFALFLKENYYDRQKLEYIHPTIKKRPIPGTGHFELKFCTTLSSNREQCVANLMRRRDI